MAKIIALDIGGKRTGLAETDPLQLIASPRETAATSNLLARLKEIFTEEEYDTIVVGDPKSLSGGDSDNSERVRSWVTRLSKAFPRKRIVLQDERFSSREAMLSMVTAGFKKKQRRTKGEIDKISAAIILRSYLDG